MKTSELIRIITQDGWYLGRRGSNHDIYFHPTKAGQVTVPRHGSKEIPTGTAKVIIKQAGIK